MRSPTVRAIRAGASRVLQGSFLPGGPKLVQASGTMAHGTHQASHGPATHLAKLQQTLQARLQSPSDPQQRHGPASRIAQPVQMAKRHGPPPPKMHRPDNSVRGPRGSHSPAIQLRALGNAQQLPADFRIPSGNTGRPMPKAVQQKMESYFGADFSDVRVHVGQHASKIGALAFTTGSDVHFAPGQYNPMSGAGQSLLAHELTHVLQQRAGKVRNPFGSGMAVVRDPQFEAEAERMGRAVGHQPNASLPSRLVQQSRVVPSPNNPNSGAPDQVAQPMLETLVDYWPVAVAVGAGLATAAYAWWNQPTAVPTGAVDGPARGRSRTPTRRSSRSPARSPARRRATSPDSRRRSPARSGRMTQYQVDAQFDALARGWRRDSTAGTHDPHLVIASAGSHSCAARIHLTRGRVVNGSFSSDGCHAEMDAISQVTNLRDITRIVIEKEPCTRCAVVLNRLRLGGRVEYKNTGQKDYPTWRWPASVADPHGVLGISARVDDARDREAILTRFRTNKWW